MNRSGLIGWLTLGFLSMGMLGTVHSEAPMRAGVRLYNNGQFEAADQAWRQAAKEAPGNAELYYNLGCNAFRRNCLGEAVLYFQRTLWLNPGHGDARHNILYINSIQTNKVLPNPPGILEIIRDRMIAWMGVDGISGLVLMAFTFVCMAGWYGLRVRHLPGRRAALWFLAGTLLLALATAILFWAVVERDSAITDGVILARQQDVRSGPSLSNPVIFSIHEGLVVELAARTDGWYQVVLPNGWNGWVPEQQLVVVQSVELPISRPIMKAK